MKANTTLSQMKYEPDEVGPDSSGFFIFPSLLVLLHYNIIILPIGSLYYEIGMYV